jgi:hypothetical protein
VIVPLGQSYRKTLQPPNHYYDTVKTEQNTNNNDHNHNKNLGEIMTQAFIPHVDGIVQYTESFSTYHNHNHHTIHPHRKNRKQPIMYDFLIGMKSRLYQANLLASEAEMKLFMYHHIMKHDKTPLLSFDGGTMQHYQFSSRIIENQWLIEQYDPIRHPNDSFLIQHGYDPYELHAPNEHFEVKSSTVAKGGRGVFTKTFLPQNSMVGLYDCVHTIYLPPHTYQILHTIHTYTENHQYHSDYIQCLSHGYVDGYGWIQNTYVSKCCCCGCYVHD